MNKFTNPLENVKIASPCAQDWSAMIGDNRKRFCGDCKLNVYNLSGMTKKEAEQLLANSGGRLCVRFYRRADGTVLTKDCPVGWTAVKRRVSKTATAFASLGFALLTSLGFVSFFSQQRGEMVGQLGPYPVATPTPKSTPENLPMTGMVAPMPKNTPAPKPSPKKGDSATTGRIFMGEPTFSKNKN